MAVWTHFNTIDNLDAKIWRFMDFTKFVHLLSSKSLFFPRAHKFEDLFEGSFLPAKALRADSDGGFLTKEKKAQAGPTLMKNRERMAVSCWHVNEHESAAMWRLYTLQGRGVTVRSSIKRLETALKPHGGHLEIYHIGLVSYIDYDSDVFSDVAAIKLLDGIFHKRKSFEHERELRAVIFRGRDPKRDDTGPLATGIYVPVDLESLIEEVYVAPASPEWVRALVQRVVEDYEISAPVRQSALDAKPPY